MTSLRLEAADPREAGAPELSPQQGRLHITASDSRNICRFMNQAILLDTTKLPNVQVLHFPVQGEAERHSAGKDGEIMRR